MLFKDFSIFISSGDYFVQRSGTFLAIFIKGLKRNIPVTLFSNCANDLGEDVI